MKHVHLRAWLTQYAKPMYAYTATNQDGNICSIYELGGGWGGVECGYPPPHPLHFIGCSHLACACVYMHFDGEIHESLWVLSLLTFPAIVVDSPIFT